MTTQTVTNFAQAAAIYCFLYWAVATTIVIGVHILYPQEVRGPINYHNWRHLLLLSVILVWVVMLCFLSMFTGPLM